MTDTRKDKKLSLKEDQFVDEYIKNGGNATKAAQQVYNVTTYNSANNVGPKVVNREHVQEAIKDRISMAKDSASATLGNSLAVAIRKAQQTIQDPASRPQDISQAQKFILECQKYLDVDTKEQRTGKTEVFTIPKR